MAGGCGQHQGSYSTAPAHWKLASSAGAVLRLPSPCLLPDLTLLAPAAAPAAAVGAGLLQRVHPHTCGAARTLPPVRVQSFGRRRRRSCNTRIIHVIICTYLSTICCQNVSIAPRMLPLCYLLRFLTNPILQIDCLESCLTAARADAGHVAGTDTPGHHCNDWPGGGMPNTGVHCVQHHSHVGHQPARNIDG